MQRLVALLGIAVGVSTAVWAGAPTAAQLEEANPLRELPGAMLGHGGQSLAEVAKPPEPEKARLGRWLFFDKRISKDGTISCATCHRPENAFSEPTAVSTGIGGQKGGRKAPSFVNAAFAFDEATFWDGRAVNLEDQAKGPMTNPIEMGVHTHDDIVARFKQIEGYGPFFEKAFGDPEVTIDRMAEAIAHYERTRISGSSPWDRYKDAEGPEKDKMVSAEVKLGEELFFGKALCATCHVGNWFTDSAFHNLGIGYDPEKKSFADEGRAVVTGKPEDTGAFKTPHLRDVDLHPPYMHDGSLATLEDVVEHYRVGGTPNPHLSPKMKPLDLTADESKALVAFMKALTGEGYLDEPPALFPQ